MSRLAALSLFVVLALVACDRSPAPTPAADAGTSPPSEPTPRTPPPVTPPPAAPDVAPPPAPAQDVTAPAPDVAPPKPASVALPTGADGTPAPPLPDGEVPPLTEAQRAVFWGTHEDPGAEQLDGMTPELVGRHYLAGDEWNLQVFYKHARGRGGAYVGVGSDQAYLFIGWARPQIAWLTDYDPWVKAMHKAHRAFFLTAATPTEYRAFWTKKGEPDALALIAREYADDADVRIVAKVYKEYRSRVAWRLHRVSENCTKNAVPSYLDDQATYDFVRGMIRAGRVRPLVANLLGDGALREISDAARTLGAPIRVLYLSNAEEYWVYPAQFRANMTALPVDDGSIMLRALATNTLNEDYCYAVQPMASYVAWLADTRVRKVYQIANRRRYRCPEETAVYVVSEEPPPPPAPRKGR